MAAGRPRRRARRLRRDAEPRRVARLHQAYPGPRRQLPAALPGDRLRAGYAFRRPGRAFALPLGEPWAKETTDESVRWQPAVPSFRGAVEAVFRAVRHGDVL